MRRRLSVLFVLAAYLALPLHPAVAEPSAVNPDDQLELAKGRFEQAVDHLGRDDFAAALIAFEESYRLHANPTVLLNIAMCHKELDHFIAAYRAFQSFLEQGDPGVDHRKRRLSQDALAELDRFVAWLQIENAPPGAEVFTGDEKLQPLGSDGRILLEAGHRQLVIRAPDHEPLPIAIDLPPGRVSVVSARLTPVFTTLRVDCAFDGALVHVDDAFVGTCPFEGKFAKGEHELRVSAPGRTSFEQPVALSPWEALAVSVQLDMLPLPTAAAAVPVAEPGARVDQVDGKGAGSSGKIWGWTALGTGVAAAAVGGSLLYRWRSDAGDLDDLQAQADQALAADDQTRYEQLQTSYNQERDEFVDSQGAHTTGMWISFGLAGALMTTGAILLWRQSRRERPDSPPPPVAIAPSPGGLAVRF